MTNDGVDLDDQMEVVARRVEFINLLEQEGALETRGIVDALDHSRSTVTRALRALREADLIEKTADGYVATLPGILAAEVYRRYETASKAVLTSKQLLAPIPEPHAPPVDLLIEADTIFTETDIPIRPMEAISDRVREANTVRAYLPTLVNTHLLRVWHGAVVAKDVDGEAIFDPDLLTVLKGQYPQLLAEMAAMEGFSAFASTGLPYGLVLATTRDSTTVSVVVYEDDTAVRGVLTSESKIAVEWARNAFERLRREAADVTEDLDALSAAVTNGMPDRHSVGMGQRPPAGGDRAADTVRHALPIDLEVEGFERLSPEYFDTQSQAPPALSWRTGFTLAEVRAGHSVDRLDDDGRNLTDKLVERLRATNDQVVLGLPGSGKSTICMAVACAWYDREVGPVLYRERGSGEHFESSVLLEAYLRQTDAHALVVVEDAVRDEANAIFDVMQALEDSPDVTFLLDARTHEWRDADASPIDARRTAYRRVAIDQVTTPALDEQECARFVDHFSDLVEADLDLSGAELYSMIDSGTTTDGDDRVSAGDVLVAQHCLSRRYDPLGDADEQTPTALDEEVRRTYQALADAEARFTLELAVLINLLNAAGIPVASEYLYPLAATGEYAALDEAITLLKGRLLFKQDHRRGGPPTAYRTRHEEWSLRFLEQFLDLMPTQRARDRFGWCVSRLLALADRPNQRQRIQRHLGGRTPHLHQIEADPGNWADEIVARIFGIGCTNASLAPLFGETTTTTIDLPDACSVWTHVVQAYWYGEMNRLHGDLERAKREFQMLRERAESVDLSDEKGPIAEATVGTSSIGLGAERVPGESRAVREHWRAMSLTKLGRVAEMRGDLETAAEYHEESLALFREISNRHGEAWGLGNRGIVARWRGNLETAAEYHEESLALFRELEDCRGEAWALDHLGVVARKRRDLEAAVQYHEESLALHKEIGDREGEAYALDNRGIVARERGNLEAAADYHEKSLALSREMGDRDGEAWALNNLGVVARERGELAVAAEYIKESLVLYREISDSPGEAEALDNLGAVHRERGDPERARTRFAEAADLCVTIGAEEAVTALTNVVDVCERQGDLEAAREWCRRAIDFAEQTDRGELDETFSARRADLADSDETSSSS